LFNGKPTDHCRKTIGSKSKNQLLKSGKRHGKWKFYYRNGKTKAVGKYADGELDGFWEWWRENGQPLQANAFELPNYLAASLNF
jgi:antitoxin component YwqK of YwqJK toxin-antitoxin module